MAQALAVSDEKVKHPRKKSSNREMAELVHAAIEAISDAELRGSFVKVERVMRRKNMAPTDHQKSLYNFVRRRGFVPREWTLGMHWGMLGGLMARGLIVPVTRDGREGVEAA